MLKADFKDSPVDPEWSGYAQADFLGRTFSPEVVFTAEDDGDYTRQTEAFRQLADKWDELQPEIADAIIGFYESEMRYAYGPDDRDELEKMWPEIDSRKKLSEYVSLDSIILPSAEDMDGIYGGDTVFLCFGYTFGSDTDAEGIGVRVTGCAVAETGTSDIAY